MVAVVSGGPEFQRWEMPNVGNGNLPNRRKDDPPPPTVSELEALQQQAREEGYAAGHAEGLAAARQQMQQKMARFDALCEAAARPLQSFDDRTEQELARLAIVMARRVIARELQLSPDLIARAVRQAADALPAATRELRVRLHPDDLDLLYEMCAIEGPWTTHADASLTRGGCQLESERSRLDATVEARLAAVIDAVLGDDADDEANG
jgi:flagellar assembly protein FliH